MQRKKLGTAVIWMVCLLGLVAVVWSRPPVGTSGAKQHPPLALAGPEEPLPPAQPVAIEPVAHTGEGGTPRSPAQPQPAEWEHRMLPAGEWVREIPPYKAGFRFEGRRLFVELAAPTDLGPVQIFLSADYQITQDAILYGVITSAKVDFNQSVLEVQMTSDRIARSLIDQPFALRYRLDADALTIKDFKMPRLLEEDPETWKQLVQFLTSRYESKEAVSEE